MDIRKRSDRSRMSDLQSAGLGTGFRSRGRELKKEQFGMKV